MAKLTLGAALIVKDEEENLPDCLESLKGVVDEIVVYDTGSTDRTVEIARSYGARVQLGHWDGDFSRARNEALAMSRTTWVLSIDADERVVAPRRGVLRTLLTNAYDCDVLIVRIDNRTAEGVAGGHEHPAPRLMRRRTTRWAHALHEMPTRRDGREPVRGLCPTHVLSLVHTGYTDPALVSAKLARNAEIARAAVADLAAHPERLGTEDAAAALLNLGRSLVGFDKQMAVDAFELLRAVVPGTQYAWAATAALGDLLVEASMGEPALVLAEQMRAGGVDGQFCDWLRARALVALDRRGEALQLLRGIERLVDPIDRTLPLAHVLELRTNLAVRLHQHDEAVASLVQAMAVEGSVFGNGPLLARLWGVHRPAGHLAELIASCARPQHLGPLVAELAACPEPGPAVSALLAGRVAAPA